MKKTITVFAFIVAIIMIVCSCVTADNANISRNSRYSSSPSLVVDPSGNPHIAWYDNKYGMLYTHWNCSDWVCADGTVYDPASGNANVSINSDSSSNPSLALDSFGNPHIACFDYSYGNPEILYTRWNGNDWVCADGSVYDPPMGNDANVSRNSGRSHHPSLALDSTGNPHIAWQDYSYGKSEILYTHWNGSDWLCADGTVYDPASGNANVSTNSDSSSNPSIALDSSGNPHIVWQDYNYGNVEILYTHWDGSDWVCANRTVYDPARGNANVSRNSSASISPSFTLDSSGNPHIVWGDGNYIKREIFYTRWNGNDWVCADGTVFDPDLEPNPANISKNSGHSEYSSITLDSSDNLHIVWRCDYDSHRNSEMLYIRWDGTDWVCANGSVYDPDVETNPTIVSRNSGYSYQPSLALDSFGNPHIAWDKYDILYTHWNSSDWVCADGEVYDP